MDVLTMDEGVSRGVRVACRPVGPGHAWQRRTMVSYGVETHRDAWE